MKRKWTDEEALELIAKVEAEFETHLADMKPLVKSEGKTEEVKTEEVKAEALTKAEEVAAPATTEAVEMTAGGDDVEELYKSMSKEEKTAHYSALKKAMGTEEMKKSEEAAPVATKEEPKKDEETSLLKSEVAALKAANEELKKNQDSIVAALSKKFAPKQTTAPKQKAITELGALNKSETKDATVELSDKEVRKALGEKAKDPSLKKSDRDLINAYCYNKVDVSAVKHLIG
jgi:hypothetical protein